MTGGRPSAYFQFWTHFDNRARTSGTGGPLTELFAAMTPAQRTRVERELLHRLEKDPESDGWVIVALGELGSSEAVPVLRTLLDGPVAEDAAFALWRLESWGGAVNVLSRVVKAVPSKTERRPPTMARRLDAARYLAEIGSPRAKAALRELATTASAPYRLQRAVNSLL